MQRARLVGAAATAALVAMFILFWNLGGYALWDPDEARHAEVARELFAASDFRGRMVPSLNFRPYYDKPILFYWLTSAAYAVGGVNELSARIVSAAAALVTVLGAYAWAAGVWGARAALAAAVVLVTAGEFAALGRYANLDMLLTLWITLGLFSVHRWAGRAEGGASLVPAAIFAALGTLTKGLVAPVLIGGVGFSYLAVTRRLRLLRHARLGRAALAFVAVAGPWYIAAGLTDRDYLHELFVRHHFQRYFQEARYLHPGPIYYYVPMLLLCFLPWSLLLPITAVRTLVRERRGDAERFCVCWVLGVLVFFSTASGKLGTYILPALPPLALLTGRAVAGIAGREALSPLERRLLTGGIAAVAALFFIAAPVLMALSARIYGGAWMTTSLLAAVLLPFGALLVMLLRRQSLHLTPVTVAAGITTALLVFYTWGAPAISAVRSEAPLAAAIAAADGDDGRAPVVAYSVRTPSLLFYLQRRVREIDHAPVLKRILSKHPMVYVVTSPKHVPTVLESGTLFPWHTGGRHVLYASAPAPQNGGGPAHGIP
jgi:4-amino-4-deoxy-L-arabinose transferase-like glycosyltransferase